MHNRWIVLLGVTGIAAGAFAQATGITTPTAKPPTLRPATAKTAPPATTRAASTAPKGQAALAAITAAKRAMDDDLDAFRYYQYTADYSTVSYYDYGDVRGPTGEPAGELARIHTQPVSSAEHKETIAWTDGKWMFHLQPISMFPAPEPGSPKMQKRDVQLRVVPPMNILAESGLGPGMATFIESEGSPEHWIRLTNAHQTVGSGPTPKIIPLTAQVTMTPTSHLPDPDIQPGEFPDDVSFKETVVYKPLGGVSWSGVVRYSPEMGWRPRSKISQQGGLSVVHYKWEKIQEPDGERWFLSERRLLRGMVPRGQPLNIKNMKVTSIETFTVDMSTVKPPPPDATTQPASH